MFKGSGFYKTDYRSESYRKAAAAEKKTNGDGSQKGKSKEKSAEKAQQTSGAKES